MIPQNKPLELWSYILQTSICQRYSRVTLVRGKLLPQNSIKHPEEHLLICTSFIFYF